MALRLLLKKSLTVYLTLWVLLLGGFTPDGFAMLIPSTLSWSESDSQRQQELQKIQSLLESKRIAQRLSDLGFTAQEIQERLTQLSDDQIHQIAQYLDSLQTGGDALGIVIALLVIAILVVILLQLTGHKIIVTK